MDIRYDAFISYNHNPRDIRITKMLQQKLEHYKIPKGIKTSTGKTKIERVFLDTGELEVSGDLNDVILTALRNTDKLIVICSPESYASPWVKREIEYFLQFGTRDDILTVLTEGEPRDVMPDILRFKEVTAEDGSVHMEPAEPLACDYRLPVKEANKKELPRLVSAIIGCKYDDLVQRHRQYVQKIKTRIAAGSAALLTLASSYMVWSNHKLQVSYNNTLIEQSNSLILQSEDALSQGDRIDAAQYAIEALPSAEKKRPLVPGAVYALANALNLYHTPNTVFTEAAARHYKGTVNGKAMDNANVSDIGVANVGDSKYFCARYNNGSLCIWDRASGEQVMTDYTDGLFNDGQKVQGMVSTDDGRLFIICDTTARCLDLMSGSEKWSYDSGEDYNAYRGASFAGDTLWLDTYMFDDGLYRVQGLEGDTGKRICEYTTSDSPESIIALEGGSYAACSFAVGESSDEDVFKSDHYRIGIIGPSGSKCRTIAEFPYICSMGLDSRDRLVVASQDKDPGYDLSEFSMGVYIDGGTTTILNALETKTYTITCLDLPDGNTVWSSEVSGMFSSTPKFSSADAPESEKDKLACTIGRTLIYFDENGKQTGSVNTGSPVSDYYRKNDDDRLYAVLADGSRASISLDEGNINLLYNIFLAPISEAVSDGDSLFIVCTDAVSDGDKIIEYHLSSADPKWQEYEKPDPPDDWVESSYGLTVFPYGEGCVEVRECFTEKDGVTNRNGGSRIYSVTLRDISEDKKGTTELLLEPEYYYTFFRLAGNRLYLVGDQNYEKNCIDSVDLDTGEKFHAEAGSDISLTGAMGCAITEEAGKPIINVLYSTRNYDEPNTLCLLHIDPETGENDNITLHEMSDEEYSYIDSFDDAVPYFDSNSGCVWVYFGQGPLVKYDAATGEELDSLDIGDIVPKSFTVSDAGTVFILEEYNSDSRLHVFSSKLKKEITCNTIRGFLPVDNDLRAETLPDANILVYSAKYGDAVMIDPLEFKVIGRMYDFKAINKSSGDIFLEAGHDTATGHVPYRMLDDIILEGLEFTKLNQ